MKYDVLSETTVIGFWTRGVLGFGKDLGSALSTRDATNPFQSSAGILKECFPITTLRTSVSFPLNTGVLETQFKLSVYFKHSIYYLMYFFSDLLWREQKVH